MTFFYIFFYGLALYALWKYYFLPLGLEYIRASLQAQSVSPVIILLPFVGGFSRALNTACREMVHSGAVLIAAAGNFQEDACMYSPASEPEV